jgi:hypothetical protein
MDRTHDFTHYLQQCVSISESIKQHLGNIFLTPPPYLMTIIMLQCPITYSFFLRNLHPMQRSIQAPANQIVHGVFGYSVDTTADHKNHRV